MRDKIIAIIKKHSQDGLAPLDGDSLFDGGFLDSFALPEVVAELEREFQIQIPDSDLNPRKFESIERIQEYLAERT